jgi:AP-4 complex subunit mu-1
MNYRITSEFRAPFKIFPFLEELSEHKMEMIVKVRADIPDTNYGANVRIEFPVPKATATVSTSLGSAGQGQATEYREKDRKVVWTVRKFPGGSEYVLKVKITLSQPATRSTRREFGPISMKFEVPMYNVSNLQVRYLRIAETHASYKPYRWVRYVTQSDSFVCRI